MAGAPRARPALCVPGRGPRAAAEQFYYLYFAMTGLHAVHLTIGIVMVLVFALALRGGRRDFATETRLEVAGLYWHFVDVIWIFPYPLLYLIGRAT